MRCKVCDKELENDNLVCKRCGFDESRNYEDHPTAGPINTDTHNIDYFRRQWYSNLSVKEGVTKKKRKVVLACIAGVCAAAVIVDGAYFIGKMSTRQSSNVGETTKSGLVAAETDAIETPATEIASVETLSTEMVAAETSALGNSTDDLSNAAIVGAYVTFGTYEQDNDTTNGAEPIEWRVLAVEDGKVLLISKYALDCQPYNEENEAITWKYSTLRSWLNSDFYNTAFTTEEQCRIQTTTVLNPDSYRGYDADGNMIVNNTGEDITDLQFQTSGGGDTKDNVFLLSLDEAQTYFDYTSEVLTKTDGSTCTGYPDLQCTPTDYAKAQGVSKINYYTTIDGDDCCWWWLRSPGSQSIDVSNVDYVGWVSYFDYVNYSVGAIRPALWVTIS